MSGAGFAAAQWALQATNSARLVREVAIDRRAAHAGVLGHAR